MFDTKTLKYSDFYTWGFLNVSRVKSSEVLMFNGYRAEFMEIFNPG